MSQNREPRERTLELDRLVNFSDAVFAIAATVLVLSIGFSLRLEPPDLDRKLWHEFGDVLPQVLAYALSFFIIARNWLGHHRIFKMIRPSTGGSSRSTSRCSGWSRSSRFQPTCTGTIRASGPH